MIEKFDEHEDGAQTALNISETLIKSREVVTQSKILLSKINSINQSSISQSKISKVKSLDQSSYEFSQISPTLRGHDIESYYLKESIQLKQKISALEVENSLLKLKLKEKDLQITKFSETLKEYGLGKIQNSINEGKIVEGNKLSLKLSNENKLKEKNKLEKRLSTIASEYNEQVSFSKTLTTQIEEFLNCNNVKKISELEEKIKQSNENFLFLSKRLEKTEAMLSRNVTPTRLEVCSSLNSGQKLRKKKKSCAVVSYKSKKV